MGIIYKKKNEPVQLTKSQGQPVYIEFCSLRLAGTAINYVFEQNNTNTHAKADNAKAHDAHHILRVHAVAVQRHPIERQQQQLECNSNKYMQCIHSRMPLEAVCFIFAYVYGHKLNSIGELPGCIRAVHIESGGKSPRKSN